MATNEKRDQYFDNARFMLILLVVVGHMISPYRHDQEILNAAYKFIYTFHMPAFILISGFFAKGIFKPGYLTKLTKKLLLPYFIFQIIFSIFFSVTNNEIQFSIFDPHWTLWFLLSLIGWNLLLFVFSKIPYSFTIAVAIGVLIGLVPVIGTYLSLSRTFVFFPLFLLGYKLDKTHFQLLTKKKYKVSGAAFLVLLFSGYYFLLNDMTRDWLLASSSYAELGVDESYGVMIRLILYGVVFWATFSVLALIPRRQFVFTKIGERTLYVYLLHGLTIKSLEMTPFYQTIVDSGYYFLLVGLALMLTFVLASRPVIRIAKPLIEPQKVIAK
ncbi:acyltransferase family protein [Salinibacillus xinjiangensis]|nr:acyltransferase family protein [Salinibacillus xinjiangensis]